MTKKERELAIDIFEDNFTVIDTHGHYTEEEECLAIDMAIKALEQEPKTGHWKVVSDGYGDSAYICECSECKDTVWVYKDADRKWNFCPNCGAKMESEE